VVSSIDFIKRVKCCDGLTKSFGLATDLFDAINFITRTASDDFPALFNAHSLCEPMDDDDLSAFNFFFLARTMSDDFSDFSSCEASDDDDSTAFSLFFLARTMSGDLFPVESRPGIKFF
jgi:hypothetical protein